MCSEKAVHTENVFGNLPVVNLSPRLRRGPRRVPRVVSCLPCSPPSFVFVRARAVRA